MDRSLEEMLSEWLVLADAATPGIWSSDWDDNGFFWLSPIRGSASGSEGDQVGADFSYIAHTGPAFAKALIAAVRSRLSVQGEELPELDVSRKAVMDVGHAYLQASTAWGYDQILSFIEAEEFNKTPVWKQFQAMSSLDQRERQLRAAYAEIKRLSQPPAGASSFVDPLCGECRHLSVLHLKGKCTFDGCACHLSPERPKRIGGNYRPHYAARAADAYMDALEAEIRRLKGEMEVEKALVETFTLPKEFSVADLYYDERGDQTDYGRVIDAVMQGFVDACEKRYPSDHPHDLIYDSDGDIDEAIHFVASGMMNRACESAEKSLFASRADALSLRQTLRRHAIHMSYDSPGDVPEPCGLWCELCSEHVEDDRVTGHKSDCLLSEPPFLARMEQAS